MPEEGQCSIAVSSASWVRSSASGTSRSMRDRLVIRRGCSTRQTARMVRLISAAFIAADSIQAVCSSGAGERVDDLWGLAPGLVRSGHHANLAGSFPARHMLDVQLHELPGRGQRLLLVAEFEDREAADHFLGFDERS